MSSGDAEQSRNALDATTVAVALRSRSLSLPFPSRCWSKRRAWLDFTLLLEAGSASLTQNVVVAWNATRRLYDAMPILRLAESVPVFAFE